MAGAEWAVLTGMAAFTAGSWTWALRRIRARRDACIAGVTAALRVLDRGATLTERWTGADGLAIDAGAAWVLSSRVDLGRATHEGGETVSSEIGLDMHGRRGIFRVREARTSAVYACTIQLVRDVAAGASAFDANYVIDAEPALARHALDPLSRAAIELLRGLIAQQSADDPALDIEWTDDRLVLRFAATLTPEITRAARDLLLRLRTRVLERAVLEPTLEHACVGCGPFRAAHDAKEAQPDERGARAMVHNGEATPGTRRISRSSNPNRR